MYFSSHSKRETYKLIEKLTSRKFTSELSLLKSLVRDIVDLEQFEISGGRIWELIAADSTYRIRYQYGNVKKIPQGYSVSIAEHEIFSKLTKYRTILDREKDELLKELGISVYSITGVGDIIKLRTGKYYKYALGFNAPEIMQSFDELLSIISSVATISLRSLTTQALQKKMRRDISQASEIQRGLLPEHYCEYHDYKIFGVCLPDSGVGGDYFDYLKNNIGDEERLGIVISDAASKGLPAAIQALFVSGAIRMGMGYSTRISNLFSKLNTLIFDTFPYERFVTLFYCELTLSTNRLVLYANAGHCPPIHYSPSKDTIHMLEPTGGFLGILQQQKFEVENITMEPGDVLALYTDGITDGTDKDGTPYGEQRLCEMIKKFHSETAQNTVYSILDDVQKYTSESTYSDDKTLIIIKRDSQ